MLPSALIRPATSLLRRALGALGLALLLCQTALADSPVLLDAGVGDVDPWSAVTILADPQGGSTIDDVMQRAREFAAPAGRHANLGVRDDAVWMRVPVRVPDNDDGRWRVDIDYPSLDRIDVYVVIDGILMQRETLGDHLPYNARPVRSRSHAADLRLQPGQAQEVWLRVKTRSSMIVPLRFVKADVAHDGETRVQMGQGLVAGLALCLALFALSQWRGNRDPMYLYYALTLIAVGLFFFSYYGLAPQHLWPDHAWMTDNAAPVFVLCGIAGTMLLVERLLEIRATSRALASALQALALVALASAALFVFDVVSYRGASLIGTVLGPMPILLGVHLAWRQSRAGDEAARYVLIGWGAYAAGVLVMAALLRGAVDANAWTQHAFQAGWLCESVAWMRVLGVRAAAIRRQVALANHERELMARMAHTDPLTGLPNRRGLDLALQDALSTSSAKQGLAVYVIDLDGFKAVNDRLGHDAGDELLVAAAQRMTSRLRGGDVVARLGGDEFVVLARHLADESVAWQVGRKLLEAFGEPFEIGGERCHVGLTIGFALAPQDGTRASDLLKRADAAMYAGKGAGKGTVRRGGASAGLVSA